jgi:two-component system, NtrC family, response regulator HydG
MPMRKNILVVDDEESIRFTFEDFLTGDGYAVSTAASYEDALGLLDDTDFDLLFVDIIMGGKTGIDLLREVKRKNPNTQVIIITGAPSVETATEALRLGALDYILKPVRQDDLLRAARLACRYKSVTDEKDHCRSNIEAIFKSVKDAIVTVDEKMRVVDVNDAAMTLCGFARDDTPGAFIRTVTGGCGGGCTKVLKETLNTRKPAEIQYVECHRKNKPRQIVSVSAAPLIDYKDKFSGCVLVLRDETRLFHLEQSVKQHTAFDRIIGTSAPITEVIELIKALTNVQTTVLVTGESGTGKELVVDALHRTGEHASGPLIKVNCGALTESILESELFGHVKGAFTGAVGDKIGRFQLADGGTLFLDEIGDISSKMQVKLLRVLESGTFEPVGSAHTLQVNVRVVAATNRDLVARVAAGEFREDLYYRLRVVQISLPPLRERKDDIPLLITHLIQKFNRRFDKKIKAISSDAERMLLRHAWPGNIRELENAIEHAFILCNQRVITLSHLPPEFREQTPGTAVLSSLDRRSEAEAIEAALQKTDGNKAKAARLLSMSRRTFYRKIEKYNIAG